VLPLQVRSDMERAAATAKQQQRQQEARMDVLLGQMATASQQVGGWVGVEEIGAVKGQMFPASQACMCHAQ
jgi:hypothetical protein